MDHVVPLSGGWDSAFCLIRALETRHPSERVVAMFVDYGQPYLRQEQRAVARIMARFSAEAMLRTHTLPPMQSDGAVFEQRNARILELALTHFPDDGDAAIWFGSRCPLPLFDRYGDSNWLWARRQARELGCRVFTPATLLPKWWMRLYVRGSGITDADIYSTEGYDYTVDS